MALFLVQHGKSLPKEEDPDRGLSRQGIEETEAVAAMAAEQSIQVSRIIHSGKKRALQTAEIFMKVLEPEFDLAKGPGLAPLDDVTCFPSVVDIQDNIMVVGHLPFMERLVSYLVIGSTETLVVKFQNSGIVCLDSVDDNQSIFISGTIFPRLY